MAKRAHLGIIITEREREREREKEKSVKLSSTESKIAQDYRGTAEVGICMYIV